LAIEPFIDHSAERIVAIGSTALVTARSVAAQSAVKRFPLERSDDVNFVGALADRFTAHAKSTRQRIDHCTESGDADSTDLLTGLSRELDKSLWLLEAHIV
jgi:starvation-inducible DNA-binding protein